MSSVESYKVVKHNQKKYVCTYAHTYIHTSEWQHKKYTHNILKIYVPIITCVTSTLIDIPSVRFKIFKVNHLEKGKEKFNDIEFKHNILSLTEKADYLI